MATPKAKEPLAHCPRCGAPIWTTKHRKFHPCYKLIQHPKP